MHLWPCLQMPFVLGVLDDITLGPYSIMDAEHLHPHIAGETKALWARMWLAHGCPVAFPSNFEWACAGGQRKQPCWPARAGVAAVLRAAHTLCCRCSVLTSKSSTAGLSGSWRVQTDLRQGGWWRGQWSSQSEYQLGHCKRGREWKKASRDAEK